jgi:hypothetical protein
MAGWEIPRGRHGGLVRWDLIIERWGIGQSRLMTLEGKFIRIPSVDC